MLLTDQGEAKGAETSPKTLVMHICTLYVDTSVRTKLHGKEFATTRLKTK